MERKHINQQTHSERERLEASGPATAPFDSPGKSKSRVSSGS